MNLEEARYVSKSLPAPPLPLPLDVCLNVYTKYVHNTSTYVLTIKHKAPFSAAAGIPAVAGVSTVAGVFAVAYAQEAAGVPAVVGILLL